MLSHRPSDSTTQRAWRFRQCPNPAGRAVMPAGELITYFEDDPWEAWTEGQMQRMCPECCHLGPTADFEVVRERHSEPTTTAPAPCIGTVPASELVKQLDLGLAAEPLSASAAGRTWQ